MFVGPNNSGKSSALSAINFIAQSIGQRDLGASPISINGPFEQLGTFVDVVHGNRPSSPMGFDLSYGPDNDRERHNIKFEIKYRSQRRAIEISRFSYKNKEKEVYSYSAIKDSYSIRVARRSIERLAPDIKKQPPRFLNIFPVDRTVSRYANQELYPTHTVDKKTSAFLSEIDRQMRRGRVALRDAFGSYDSISPFRDPPERTYLFTGETPSRIGRTGSNGISLLVNDVSKRGLLKARIADVISEWLVITGIASGIVLRPLTERHFEICIRDLDGTIHNICDVGFGCSQVLPVLIGALNILWSRNSRPIGSTPTFVVQEPEIHLHPNAQAALGSFFVALAKLRGQTFIETHSDNLVLRIATHVAAGHIDPKDVAIFYCQNVRGKKEVQKITIDEKGVFRPKWPGGFFPQRENETFALAQARRDVKQLRIGSNSGFFHFR